MLFNSFEFLLFFPVVFILYWFLFNKNVRTQNLLILLASYVFYGWWSWTFLLLLITSTILDYLYGFGVAKADKRQRKLFLWLSVINNLGILGVFKYYNFFATEFQKGFDLMGWEVNPLLLSLALPVGISFYTFHGMSYVFDIYRGLRKPVTNFTDYAVFVCFFPLLVAGPIERANHLLPQVMVKRIFRYEQAVQGGRLMIWGLFKKMVIADSLSPMVDDIFLNYQTMGPGSLALGAIGFSFQIYADFSGYSDIAIGTAKMMGFELFSNFRFPYLSRSVPEFWRRWHISLSSWFRDYLYIPLGGSREGKWKAVRNVFIIFLVSGFWHGANWNFIMWGGIHAMGFLPFFLMNKNRDHLHDVAAVDRSLPSLREFSQMVATFCFVSFAWIFFRADGIACAFDFISKMVMQIVQSPASLFQRPNGLTMLMYIVPFILMDWKLRRDERTVKFFSTRFADLVLLLIILIFVINNFLGYLDTKPSNFIYFEF